MTLSNPLELFKQERNAARGLADPWSGLCALASISRSSHARVRTLVLREIEDRLAIFINATSPKFYELPAGGHAQLSIYLASIAVQYRLDVQLESIPKHLVDESWLLRPRVPKQMDWYYTEVQEQSTPIQSRDHLKRSLSAHARDNTAEKAPPTAQGLYLNVQRIERLELLADEVHARTLWQLDDSNWTEQILVP
jgi:pyridoxine/pyridoxamine 5'-phosphate oxidase